MGVACAADVSTHSAFGPGFQVSIKMTQLQSATLFCGLLLTQAAVAQAQVVVGETTLVIGQAQIINANGKSAPVTRGSVIQVGDVIQTEIGGHVHLRFVDGGRVSVRPSSRLQVEHYTHSVQQPQLSAIKFTLQEGVVRSITGSWGESARERFRLNTPLAAIGVKGTDFMVRANADATAATVFAGAIAVAPLQGSCINTLGPCMSGSEKLLSEDMKGQMVELARLQTAPRLVPAVDLMVASLPQTLSSVAQPKAHASDHTVLMATGDKPLLGEERIASVVNALGAETTVASTSTLGWARFAWAQKLSGDDFSQQFEAAMLKGNERLGGSGAYTLLRQATEGQATVFAPLAGKAQFQLAAVAGNVIRDNGSAFEAVHLDAASLSVDFTRATFATRLQVTGPQLGVDTVQAAGGITSAGMFQATSGNSSLQGGLSANGREAGYAFQKSVDGGVLSGITLWGR